jgi:hypothetical protein
MHNLAQEEKYASKVRSENSSKCKGTTMQSSKVAFSGLLHKVHTWVYCDLNHASSNNAQRPQVRAKIIGLAKQNVFGNTKGQVEMKLDRPNSQENSKKRG